VLGCGWFGGIGLLALALGSFGLGAFCVLVAAGFGALLVYLYHAYGSLTVAVDAEKVSLSFGARTPFDIPLSAIRGCSVTPLPFAVTAMWGRQRQADFVGVWSPFRKQGALGVPRAFWIGGGEWVVVDLVRGRQVCVGSDEPYELAAAIGQALASRTPDGGGEAGVTPVRPLSVV
jgi:hypothetical protein